MYKQVVLLLKTKLRKNLAIIAMTFKYLPTHLKKRILIKEHFCFLNQVSIICFFY